MSDCTIVINEEYNPITVVIDEGPTIPVLSEFLSVFTALTAKWQETAEEMDTIIQPLTAKWQETAEEMDTLQIAPTGHWQGVYEYIDRGVVDAGYF